MAEENIIRFRANRFWAIQLSDSERRSWSDNNENASIFFDWRDIQISWTSNHNDISISVAKQFPDKPAKAIKNIANGIYYFPRLKVGDGILGVDGTQIVKKIGIIKHNATRSNHHSHSAEILIKWIKNIEGGEANIHIFDKSAEIQRLGPKDLSQINLPIEIEDKYDIAYALANDLPFLNLTISEKVDASPKEDEGGPKEIFYGTNRNRTGDDDLEYYYGDELSKLKYGKCLVSIPRGHEQGKLEKPLKIWKISFPENEKRHIILKNIEEMTEDVFLKQLSIDLSKAKEKSALVFVHGYNTTFAQAARRTAQIAWDVPFEGISGFFSWPSQEGKLGYLKDIERADATVPQFQEFIELLLSKFDLEKLHFIAHSMGNRLLTVTLNSLGDNKNFTAQLKIIEQIILAAPDIDQNVFRNNILPKFKKIGMRRTLYSSDKDKALKWSKKFRNGEVRLGDAGDDIFVEPGLDTIDASNVESEGNNHNYMFDTTELLSDLHYVLNEGLPPQRRRLSLRVKESLNYWLFRK